MAVVNGLSRTLSDVLTSYVSSKCRHSWLTFITRVNLLNQGETARLRFLLGRAMDVNPIGDDLEWVVRFLLLSVLTSTEENKDEAFRKPE